MSHKTSRQWWQATDEEVRLIVTQLHFAEAMANDREDNIALTTEMLCKPSRFCLPVDVIEIVHPNVSYVR